MAEAVRTPNRHAESPPFLEAGRSLVREVRRRLEAPETLYRLSLRLRGAAQMVLRPHPARWRNGTLRSVSDWRYAAELIRAVGLPRHPDPPRNWDTLAALRLVLEETDEDDPVLDVGPDARSALVEWLYLLGYRRLEVLNPSFSRAFQRGPIQYRPGELADSPYRPASFRAVASLDAGERWETLERRLPEIWRLLRPDGVLVVSTKYWETPSKEDGRNGSRETPRILSRPEIRAFLRTAREHGFEPPGTVDLDVREHALRPPHGRPSTTLLKLALRKRTRSGA